MFERTCTNYKLPVVPRTPEERAVELAEVELLRQAEGLTSKEKDYVAKRRLSVEELNSIAERKQGMTPKEEKDAYDASVWRNVENRPVTNRALASAQKALDKPKKTDWARVPVRLLASFAEVLRGGK